MGTGGHGRSRAVPRRAGLVLLAAVILGAGCRALPPRPETPSPAALGPATSGPIAEAADAFRKRAPDGDSGFLLVPRADEALLWRLAMVNQAVSSIDAQYYIWNSDESATLLFSRLLEAADRGVRVRLIVDDFGIAGDDRNIAALCAHPNFKLAIYNPITSRGNFVSRGLELVFELGELNRRMHNKLFVADGRLAVVGGRNIGNPYFGLSAGYNFCDLGVLVAGPVVAELTAAFDEYWNAPASYPGIGMSDAEPADLDLLRKSVAEALEESRDRLASYTEDSGLGRERFRDLPGGMHLGRARFLQDEPVRLGTEELRLTEILDSLATPAHEELIVVSPYFIPSDSILATIRERVDEGVRVRILTSALGSSDLTIVHSHYRQYRRKILAAGAELYEYRYDPSEELREFYDVAPVRSDWAALHMKAMVGDRRRCFIGSLNLDPRALTLNTENGLYIECPGLAAELTDVLDALMSPENAWRVTMDEDGKVRWTSSAGTIDRQPARTSLQRLSDLFLGFLPVQSQL